jgi:hypothetical protein
LTEYRAAEVHAARGQRDVLVVLVGRLGIDRRVALAHVGDRVPGLAHARDDPQDLGRVIGLGEVARRPDRLPVEGDPAEERTEGEAESGQRERHRGNAAGTVGDAAHESPAGDCLALERAGHPAVSRVFGFASFFVSVCHVRLENLSAAKPY